MHLTSATGLSSLSLDTLQVFASAARCLSFRQTAELHQVTATAISHRMRQLESQLGQQLFIRQSRQLQLTSDGQILLAAIDLPLQTLQQSITSLFNENSSLTIACTPAFASHWLIPRLSNWYQQYPKCDVRIQSQVKVQNPAHGTIDIAIRCSDNATAGSHLVDDRFVAVAAPHYAASQDLIPTLHYDWHNRQLPMPQWRQWQQRCSQRQRICLQQKMHFSDESHAIQAAIAAQGAILVSQVLISRELQNGLLMPISDTSLPAASWRFVSREEISSMERCFYHWLIDQLNPQLATNR